MGFVLDFKIEGKTKLLCKKTMVLQTLLGHLEHDCLQVQLFWLFLGLHFRLLVSGNGL
jgi:hypothetical protein